MSKIINIILLTLIISFLLYFKIFAETMYRLQGAPPYVVQPDYNKWQMIKVGMTEEEVSKILGEPIHKTDKEAAYPLNKIYSSSNTVYIWNYGEITFKSYPCASSFYFNIYFYKGKIKMIIEPFNGEFSKDGTPTAPQIILPENNKVFHYYPRFVDLRWLPSSGDYPLEYEIEIQYSANPRRIPWQTEKKVITKDIYFSYLQLGKGYGRWRIRAANSYTNKYKKDRYSEWSEYRYFSFSK